MLLEVRKLRIGNGNVIDELSFAIDRGERLGLIGGSGSGKSAVALAIAGLLPAGTAVEGELVFDGAPLPASTAARAKLRRQRIALVRQGDTAALLPTDRVGGIVSDPTLLDAIGLNPTRFVSQLSAAEQQVLLIAEALSRRPDLLILDEPFTLLDAPTQKRLVDLLAGQSMAMLVIGHDFAAIAALTGTIVILDQGKFVECGPTAQILARPLEDISKHLIAGSRIRARTLMRSPIGTELLEVRGLSVVYKDRLRLVRRHKPVQALDDVSFSLRRGEALAVVGADGAGKSTLARIVAGLGRASKGMLEFERQPYHGRDMPRIVRAEISLVFSDPRRAFSPRLTLGESVTEPLLLDQHHTIDEQSDRLMDVLGGVGLGAHVLDLRPGDLGIYELQLLALARALISRPKLMVLDEPVRLLNARQRGDMLTLINRVRADFGFTALITSSNLDLMRHIADRALILEQGKIVDAGRPGELLERPGHAATRAMAEARLPEVGIGVVAPVGR